eukprot:6266623-Pyramimonas_sp.AAC.1
MVHYVMLRDAVDGSAQDSLVWSSLFICVAVLFCRGTHIRHCTTAVSGLRNESTVFQVVTLFHVMP